MWASQRLKSWTVIVCADKIDIVIPPGRHRPHSTDRAVQTLHNLIIVIGIEVTHLVTIDQIDCAFFACLHQQMLMRSGLVGKQEHATGAEVGIGLIQIILIIRSEVIGHFEAI